MKSQAIIFTQPGHVERDALTLAQPDPADVTVDVAFSGISTGTERLLWTGEMPAFPGMGYPLVPGYEAVGRIVDAEGAHRGRIGEFVFVPGANCFGEARGLFGASASRLVVPESRALAVDAALGERAILLALAATAFHASGNGAAQPELIIGHGVLGRLLARIAVLAGASPIVWERHETRRAGAAGYVVCAPEADSRRDYKTIYDASGDSSLLDALIGRLAPGGEIVLAGFYPKTLSFAFPPAFMREARLRIAAQWQPADLASVKALAESGALDLEGLITHRSASETAGAAYETAFGNPECLKMILDWRACS